MKNNLATQTSPYLLQHANNPVHWYAWSNEAFEIAKAQDKPILLSIGYSSCHWCHVMAHESFEDEHTANLMNELFINIKLDKEERPDLDAIYMDALQAMTGSGGWPLNIFLSPDKKPFYGGTYFPPKPMHNRASWKEVLVSVAQFYHTNKNGLHTQTEQLMTHLQKSFPIKNNVENNIDWNESLANEMYKNLIQNADLENGGFGNAPKFPNCSSLIFLLNYYQFTKNNNALQHACTTLNKMAIGGIWDWVGGGFARYSTDKYWIAPHFEKMLYDNAQLLEVYALAYNITQNNFYLQICNSIVNYLQTKMMDANGGFYTAQDADSNGIEGKFYIFTNKELVNILGLDSDLFCKYFSISENGNWEHQSNIIYSTFLIDEFCNQYNLDKINTLEILENCKQKLFNYRAKRDAPFKDTKIILSWNALLSKCLIQAGLYTQNKDWIKLAQKNVDYLLQTFLSENNLDAMQRIALNNQINQNAVLEDYVYLADVCIQLFITTTNEKYILIANNIMEYVLENFSNAENIFLSNTNKNTTDVILQKIELYEHSMPNANAVAVKCFNYLSIVFNNNRFSKFCIDAQNSILLQTLKIPNYFAGWANIFLHSIFGNSELCIASNKNNLTTIFNIYKNFKPIEVLINIASPSNLPYLKNKFKENENLYYLCHNKTCFAPLSKWEQINDFGFMAK